jgi:hypothetical protein
MHIIIKDKRPLDVRNKEKTAESVKKAYYTEECKQNPRLINRRAGALRRIKDSWDSFPNDKRV